MRKQLLQTTGYGRCHCALVAGATTARAEYPDRLVRIQLGFPAGGGADILARWYAEKLKALTNGNFIVENKVGASGNLALDAAAQVQTRRLRHCCSPRP